MDWVFTPSSSWDLTELDIDDFDGVEKNQNIEVYSRTSGVPENGILNEVREKKHSKTSSSRSSSSKKPRAYSGEQPASCLVDGCKADLSGGRDYNRRHRVCESHSKTPVVTIGGKEQRFCQQCSRFHSLAEFDEEKRSCRKRLDGHNRRRRKSRTESMYFNYGSFLSNHRGTKLLHFGGCSDKEELNQKLHATVKQSTPSNSYDRFRRVSEKRFPFLLEVDSEKVNQPFSESCFQEVVNKSAESGRFLVEPEGVRSLLSNSNHTMHHGSVSGAANNLVRFRGSLNQHPGEAGPMNSGHTDNQLIGMIHFRTEGWLDNETAQVLSFSWD